MKILAPVPLIQTVNAGLSGITTAELAKVFTTLTPGLLPLCQVWPGTGDVESRIGNHEAFMYYHCEVYHSSVTSGDFNQNWTSMTDLFDSMMLAWNQMYDDTETHILDFGDVSEYRIELDRSKKILFRPPSSDFQFANFQTYNGFIISLPILMRWGASFV